VAEQTKAKAGTSGAGTRRGTTSSDVQPTTPTTAPTTANATQKQDPTPPSTPTLPEPSPRNGVAVAVVTVDRAFRDGHRSQSTAYVQHALRARNIDPGRVDGVTDHATRVAFARFQQSIQEPPTGLPTERALDYLGFDVVG
jgi:hypothetical protein